MWEYKVADAGADNQQSFEMLLNQYGAQRWEFCQVVQFLTFKWVVFKKQAPE